MTSVHDWQVQQAYMQAAQWGEETMKRIELVNTQQQPIRVQYWNRGDESLVMNALGEEPIPMLGLGMSIGTPPQGITAPIVVIDSFDDLETTDVRGKIVYNTPFEGYGKTVGYRVVGPTKSRAKERSLHWFAP